jgi:alkanesulfonate monooxygenase
MTPRFHLAVPVTDPVRADLPPFLTDVRPADRLERPRQVARLAELAGLTGVVVPFHPDGLDPLVVAAALLRETSTVRVTAEFHPAVATPVYAAKLAASLQRFAGSRLAWRLRVDLDPVVARAQGDTLTGADRYARAAEFLTAAREIWRGTGVSFAGRFYQVLEGGLPASPRSARTFPRVYLSGTSPEAMALSAGHADVHLLAHGEDPDLVPDGVGRAVALTSADLADAEYYASKGVTEFFVTSDDPAADVLRVRWPVGMEAADVR